MSRRPTPDVVVLLRQECRELAREMVRLEAWAEAACQREDYVTAGDLNRQRLEAQDRRSRLLRDIWRGV